LIKKNSTQKSQTKKQNTFTTLSLLHHSLAVESLSIAVSDHQVTISASDHSRSLTVSDHHSPVTVSDHRFTVSDHRHRHLLPSSFTSSSSNHTLISILFDWASSLNWLCFIRRRLSFAVADQTSRSLFLFRAKVSLSNSYSVCLRFRFLLLDVIAVILSMLLLVCESQFSLNFTFLGSSFVQL